MILDKSMWGAVALGAVCACSVASADPDAADARRAAPAVGDDNPPDTRPPPPDLLYVQPQEDATPILDFEAALGGLGNGSAADAAAIGIAWLDSWSKLQTVQTDDGVLNASARFGADSLRCEWLRVAKSAICDDRCGDCVTGRSARAQSAKVPFRLLAIVNRVDLGSDACSESGAEARLIYVATSPETGAPLGFTTILEYGLHGPTQEWAARFRALRGANAAQSAELLRELALDLVRQDRGLASLLRVRTNETIFGAFGQWELREFRPTSTPEGPRLALAPLAGTPGAALDGTKTLSGWVEANRASIRRGDNPIPPRMQTLAITLAKPTFRWSSTTDRDLATLFSRNTCNGCHGGERPAEDMAFQMVAPVRPPKPDPQPQPYYGNAPPEPVGPPPLTIHGVELSRYLVDPTNRHGDELARREGVNDEVLRARCAEERTHRMTGRRTVH